MPEFRYTGVNVTGRPIQGTIFSEDSKAVRAKVQQAVKSKGIRIDSIEKKNVYLYKVQKGLEKPIFGEQKAFSEAEIKSALAKMGYRVLYVRKKLFDFKLKVPSKDIVLFIRICADLLREKFPHDEILTLVGADTENKRLRDTILDIQKDLKAGNEGHAVYRKHVDVFGKFPSHMFAVASTSGNMAEIYESTAKFLEREEEFKSRLRSVLLMPTVVLFAMIGTLFFYVLYIFPKMTGLLIQYNIDPPPMTAATMHFSDWVESYWLVIVAALGTLLAGLMSWLATAKGRYQFDKFLLRVPILGPVMRKTSVEIFCRVFHALYSSSGENVNAIRIAAESCRNKYIEKQITGTVITRMLKDGRSFVECLQRTNCFPTTAVRRLRSGEESGTLRENARQLADYYEKENQQKMGKLVDSINVGISIVITVLVIGLTLVSSEIGFVQPPSQLEIRNR